MMKKNKTNENRLNKWLPEAKGVIHVGANHGQERARYKRNKLDVIWIEPIPKIFAKLQKNILEYPKQKAYQRLITDKDNETYKFNVANIKGGASSIYEISQELEKMHPNIHYIETLSLQSITLSTFVQQEKINMENYDALVMDTQGSELLVLEGARNLINNFKFVRCETSSFPLYKESCLEKEILSFMHSYQFKEIYRRSHISRYGEISDIIFNNE